MALPSNTGAEMSAASELILTKVKSHYEGLVLLERLCVSGVWVPVWNVRDHLKHACPIIKALTLIFARIMRLHNAFGVLQEAGADVFRVDECGNTILHKVIAQPAILMENVTVEDATGRRPLGEGREEFILRAITFLVSYDRSLVTALNDSKELALHVAAKLGLAQIVNVLIEEGSDINALSSIRESPLSICARLGHLECMKILLDKGADTSIYERSHVFPIHLAVENGHIECVKMLIEKGADMNIYTQSGYSPLHIGVARGQVASVEVLIENQVEMDPVDVLGRTPLHVIISCRNPELRAVHMVILNLLIKEGASVNMKDDCGITPLHFAVGRGDAAIVQRLIDAGADASLTDDTDCTPLQLAESIDAEACVNILKKL